VSKIRLTPNASGTGTVTLTVPSTSTDRTITLPDTTGTLLDSSGQGVDTWYLTANKTASGTVADLTANWARLNDTNTANGIDGLDGVLGSAMSESGGIFTFPKTGIWRVEFHPSVSGTTSNDTWYPAIYHTDDNYTTEGRYALGLQGVVSGIISSMHHVEIFDIQDVSTHKVRFWVGSLSSGKVEGNTDYMRTWAIFTRLGDT
jgi:hypothetical protein